MNPENADIMRSMMQGLLIMVLVVLSSGDIPSQKTLPEKPEQVRTVVMVGLLRQIRN